MSRPIYFVSLGPGDAELITLKSLHALQQADIIYCPSTVREPDKILSRAATLLHKLGIKGDIHLFSLPMSKDRTKAIKVYRQLFEEMRLEQKAGKRLAVAVEGDAGIYASVHYVLDLLEENGIPVEQLPFPVFLHSSLRKRPQNYISSAKKKDWSLFRAILLRTNWTCI